MAGEGVGGIVEAFYALAGINSEHTLKWGIPREDSVRVVSGQIVAS